MSYYGIKVSFACRFCANSFEQINDFIIHKKENHYQEFEQTKSIIFEEKPVLNPSPSDGIFQSKSAKPGLPSTVLVKSEATKDVTSLNCKPELLNYELDKKCIFIKESNFAIIPHKIEANEDETAFEHAIQPEPCKNPVVLLKRISSKKAQKFTVDHSNPPATATLIDHTTNSLKCRLCDKNFSSEPQLRIHIQICLLYNNNNANLAYCAKCNAFFSNSQQLQVHIERCHVEQKIIEEKNQPSATTPVFNRFIRKKTETNSKSSVSSLELDQNPTTAASNCDSLGGLRESVNLKRPVFGETEDLTLCETVERNFNPSHSKRFMCPFAHCQSEFTNKLNLQKHFEQHPVSSKLFKCSFPHCESRFNEKGALRRHTRRNHDREKQFKCPAPHCQSVFKFKHCLDSHVRRHTGAKPFKCLEPNCGKAFSNVGTLYNHKATHSDLLAFECPHESCSEAFKYKRCAVRHFKAVHLESV